jgi:hypothetical protein
MSAFEKQILLFARVRRQQKRHPIFFFLSLHNSINHHNFGSFRSGMALILSVVAYRSSH